MRSNDFRELFAMELAIRNENRHFLGLLGIVPNGPTAKITLDPMLEYLSLLPRADLRNFSAQCRLKYLCLDIDHARKRDEKIKASSSEKCGV